MSVRITPELLPAGRFAIAVFWEQILTEDRRWQGDVLEQRKRSSWGRAVRFRFYRTVIPHPTCHNHLPSRRSKRKVLFRCTDPAYWDCELFQVQIPFRLR